MGDYKPKVSVQAHLATMLPGAVEIAPTARCHDEQSLHSPSGRADVSRTMSGRRGDQKVGWRGERVKGEGGLLRRGGVRGKVSMRGVDRCSWDEPGQVG